MTTTNYTKRAVFSTSLLLGMTVLASAVAYVTRVILARSLHPAEYGLFYAVFTFVSFFLFIKELGLGSALVKFIPQFQIEGRYHHIKTAILSTFIIQLLGSFVFAAAVFFGSGFLAEHYFKDPRAELMLRILLLFFFGSVFFRMYRSIFNGFQNIKVYSLLELLKNVATLGFFLLFFYGGWGIYAPAWAHGLASIFLALILSPFLLKTFSFFKHKVVDFWPVSKELLKFGLPLFATSIAGKFISDIDTLMLTYFSDLTNVGVYNVILPSATLLLFFGGTLTEATFPMMVQFWAKKDLRRLIEGLRMLVKYSLIMLIPPSLVVLVFSDFFIEAFFGKEYLAGVLPLQILIAGMLLFTVAGIIQSALLVLGRPKTVAKIFLVVAAVNIGANLLLIPRFGIIGAAFSTTLSYIVGLILSSKSLSPLLDIGISRIFVVKHILATISMVVILIYLKAILPVSPLFKLIMAGVAGILIYLLIAYLLRLVDFQEIKKYALLLRKKDPEVI